jgi:hypothetical protein
MKPKVENNQAGEQLNTIDLSDSKFTKKEVILLMEWARERGYNSQNILWDEWLEDTFNYFNKIRRNIK